MYARFLENELFSEKMEQKIDQFYWTVRDAVGQDLWIKIEKEEIVITPKNQIR